MGLTLFRRGDFRFCFFAREERRPNVHAIAPYGEAKFWLVPGISLDREVGLGTAELRDLEEALRERGKELLDAWHRSFPG